MTFDPEDPRLTAYALGELDGDERLAVERLLAADPQAQQVVARTRALAGLLGEALAAEPPPSASVQLHPAQHQAIAAELQASAVPTVGDRAGFPTGALPDQPARRVLPQPSARFGGLTWRRLALAACPLLAAGAALLLASPRAREEARMQTAGPAPSSAPEPLRPADAPVSLGLARDAAPAAPAPPLAPAAPAAPVKVLAEAEQLAANRPARVEGRLAQSAGATALAPKPGGADLAPPPTSGLDLLAMSERGTGSAVDTSGQVGGQTDPNVIGGAARGGGLARNSTLALGKRIAPTQGQMPAIVESVHGERHQIDRIAPTQGQMPATPAPATVAGAQPGLAVPAAPGGGGRESRDAGFVAGLAGAKPQAARTDRYLPIVENPFRRVAPGQTQSTFAADVDTASYAIVRRDLNRGVRPDPASVRVEELINAFDYDYAPPGADSKQPFAVHTELFRCPWNPGHDLLRIGLKGQAVRFAERRPTNLVFLVDVSGSMADPSKLTLVKAGLRMLVEQLGEPDRIAIVTYAANAGVWLPSTGGHQRATIVQAIDRLTPGGGTNGGEGIQLAYQAAQQGFIPGGVNRVILATDGDFNVGVTDEAALEQLAAEKAKSGVFLSVLGVGEGNLQDSTMKRIASHGNGQYYYLDSLQEARRVLVEQVGGTLQTIAKDLKIQVAFDPARVGAFRQIGYEARALANADFRDDAKDAGELGSEHTVTALYELVRPGAEAEQLGQPSEADAAVEAAPAENGEPRVATVRLRYKTPEAQASEATLVVPVPTTVRELDQASVDSRFAAAVAEFGLLLRGSRYAGQGNLDQVLDLARSALGPDPNRRRHEFVSLVEMARSIAPVSPPPELAAPPR